MLIKHLSIIFIFRIIFAINKISIKGKEMLSFVDYKNATLHLEVFPQ